MGLGNEDILSGHHHHHFHIPGMLETALVPLPPGLLHSKKFRHLVHKLHPPLPFGHHHHGHVHGHRVGWLDNFDRVGKARDDKKVATGVAAFNLEKGMLQNEGLRPELIDWVLIQDWMESAGYTNKGYVQHNNPGGIMWPSKGLKYGKKGSYNAANHSYWTDFPSMAVYVKEKISVLSQKPGRPIDATSGPDFVHRLKMNNYFGKQSEASYTAAMKGAASRINLIGDFYTDAHQDIVKPKGEGILATIREHPVLAGVGAAVAGILILKAVVKK